jgi:hypothetical protein
MNKLNIKESFIKVQSIMIWQPTDLRQLTLTYPNNFQQPQECRSHCDVTFKADFIVRRQRGIMLLQLLPLLLPLLL